MIKYTVNEQVVERGAHGICPISLTDTLDTFTDFKRAEELFNDRKAQAPRKMDIYERGVHITLEELHCDKDGEPLDFTIHAQYYGTWHDSE